VARRACPARARTARRESGAIWRCGAPWSHDDSRVAIVGALGGPDHGPFGPTPFWSEESSQFKAQELYASDALLLGRITYEGFAAAWPTMPGTGAFGEKMNSMPK
jgi:dihydrofolate reductase